MELILQRELPHQQRAVDALCATLRNVEIYAPVNFYENPKIRGNDPHIKPNLDVIQRGKESGVQPEYWDFSDMGAYLSYDIKMETGTGKTYVYTKTMYELHKQYGLNKFIIAVPSLAIKAGTAQFLTENYVRRHFKDVCGYDTDLTVCVLESVKKKKKGHFPPAVSDFFRGSHQDTRHIYVLLVNMQLLTGTQMLTRSDYDQGEGEYIRPLDAIKATQPIVLIDEPHRFSREQKAYKAIIEEMSPQMVVRFGATFPEITVIEKKQKKKVKDYLNLLYDLNACAAFNQNLIKGVAKEHFEAASGRNEKVKILAVRKNVSATIQHTQGDAPAKSYTLAPSDALSIVSPAFEGVTIQAITTTSVVFSNGVEKTTGEVMDVEIYMTSYQEEMIRLALKRHFEAERINFCGRGFKIKTLALFFIDDITSYRAGNDGKAPYLRTAFERLLRERIDVTLQNLEAHESEYKAFLEASLADIAACHAGYFAQDNNDTDEAVAREVDSILRGKKQLLSFRDPQGAWHTRRFLFSKWTLKEGWDNPNVFTIAKLRSSGSEISKLQEVGRGLRLPVDENGNRIANVDFQLNYIVDFTEADFAEKLVAQINGEVPQAVAITEEGLQKAAKARGMTMDDLFDVLYKRDFIDRKMNIKPENRSVLLEEYPDVASAGLDNSKVKNNNKDKPVPIAIRPERYKELRKLWETINQRYLLVYKRDLNALLEDALVGILEKGVFQDVVVRSKRAVVQSDNGVMTVELASSVQHITTRPIPYGVFLRRISQAVNVPVDMLHRAMCAYAQKRKIPTEYINETSVSAFVRAFVEWKNKNVAGKFTYVKGDMPLGVTALTNLHGEPLKEIAQGRIGTKIKAGEPPQKYLYDTLAYDSPLELDNIMDGDIDEIVVYGKIPRNSIAIPTTMGSMYSPDFMYVVQKRNGVQEVNIVLETKDVPNEDEARNVEKIRMQCAEVFFEMLRKDGYKMHFHKQLKNEKLLAIFKTRGVL